MTLITTVGIFNKCEHTLKIMMQWENDNLWCSTLDK